MLMSALKPIALSFAIAALGAQAAVAQAVLKIKIPMRARLTPVQRLNREGVKAINEHNYKKAEQLFYKAYLYDPADPFTLNNLGYTSELQGQLPEADRFYELASEQGSNADIDRSSSKGLEGKPMMDAFEGIRDRKMRVNRLNVEAMQLLSKGREFEAARLLRQALELDPDNPFTENNCGVADEAAGDLAGALRYYNEAAESDSLERVAITQNSAWSGKLVSKVAAANAARLTRSMRHAGGPDEQAVMYNLRGVHAANENNLLAAKEDFLHAYSLDPTNAFSLNNRGYVAEMNGDLESAQFFYQKARSAAGANTPVGLATEESAVGQPLFRAAAGSNEKVDGALIRYSEWRRGQRAPIELTPRGGAVLGNQPSTANPTQPSAPRPPLN